MTGVTRSAAVGLTAPVAEGEQVMAMFQRVLCRLNLHHRWAMRSTEDGSRYPRCTWCYKDGTGRWGNPIDPFGQINLTGRPRR